MQVESTQSPSQPAAIPRIVTIGRIGLIVAALVALLAAITDDRDGVTIVFLLRLFGALALIGCAIASLIKPLRAIDLGSVALAALLAGAATLWAFNSLDTSVISLFAWFMLLGFGSATGAGLAFGPPVIDRAFADQIAGALTTSGPPLSSQPYQPPPPPVPGTAAQQPPPPSAPQPPPPPSAPQPPPPPVEPAGKPAGWYPDEDGQIARWWDGGAWTESTRPLPDPDQPS